MQFVCDELPISSAMAVDVSTCNFFLCAVDIAENLKFMSVVCAPLLVLMKFLQHILGSILICNYSVITYLSKQGLFRVKLM